jgi:hypothetical protein
MNKIRFSTFPKWVRITLVIVLLWPALKVWYEGGLLYDYYTGAIPMYDISATLKVGDEVVEIERRVPCMIIAHGEFLPYLFTPWKWNNRPSLYFARDLSTGAKLADGRAVMVTIPDLCNKIAKNRSIGVSNPLLEDLFLPMVALVENPEDPQVIKLITSRSYFRRDDREVDILKYEAMPAPKNTFPDWRQDDYNWLRGGDPAQAELGYDKRMKFRRLYLIGMPLELYRQGSPEDVPVDGLTGLVSLYDIPNFKIPQSMKDRYPSSYFPRFEGFGLFAGGFYSIGLESEPYSEFLSFDHFIPVFETPEESFYNAGQRGYLMFYRDEGRKYKQPIAIEWNKDRTSILSQTHTLQFDITNAGDEVSVSNVYVDKYKYKDKDKDKDNGSGRIRAPFFYDAKTNHIYWLKYRALSFQYK